MKKVRIFRALFSQKCCSDGGVGVSSGGPLWPSKTGSGSGSMESGNKVADVESVKVVAKGGNFNQEWRALWPGKPGSNHGE